MTLQELLGELLTLSNAYPPETVVSVQTVDFRLPITGLSVDSRTGGVEIAIEVG